jgi:hypothetical protein
MEQNVAPAHLSLSVQLIDEFIHREILPTVIANTVTIGRRSELSEGKDERLDQRRPFILQLSHRIHHP